MRLKSWKIEILIKQLAKSHIPSYAVIWNLIEDIKCGSHPNLFTNMIKIKCSSVFLSLFVSVVSWLSLLLFDRLGELDSQFNHRWCIVNSWRRYYWFVLIVLIKQGDKLLEVLNRWSWLPSIFFLWISFLWK